MAETAVRESLTIAGRPDRARVARAFVGEVLGLGHPCGDVAVLLVSFSATASAIAALAFPAGWSRSLSRRRMTLSGWRSARWGWRRSGSRTRTWFEIQALLQPVQHFAVSGPPRPSAAAAAAHPGAGRSPRTSPPGPAPPPPCHPYHSSMPETRNLRVILRQALSGIVSCSDEACAPVDCDNGTRDVGAVGSGNGQDPPRDFIRLRHSAERYPLVFRLS